MKAPKDYPSLFGYISPTTGEVTTHPPLCACGSCSAPVESFNPVSVVQPPDNTQERSA